MGWALLAGEVEEGSIGSLAWVLQARANTVLKFLLKTDRAAALEWQMCLPIQYCINKVQAVEAIAMWQAEQLAA